MFSSLGLIYIYVYVYTYVYISTSTYRGYVGDNGKENGNYYHGLYRLVCTYVVSLTT